MAKGREEWAGRDAVPESWEKRHDKGGTTCTPWCQSSALSPCSVKLLYLFSLLMPTGLGLRCKAVPDTGRTVVKSRELC